MYANGVMFKAVSKIKRHEPLPSPAPPDNPFAALPCSKSRELKLTVSEALRFSVIGPNREPVSSIAVIRTEPA